MNTSNPTNLQISLKIRLYIGLSFVVLILCPLSSFSQAAPCNCPSLPLETNVSIALYDPVCGCDGNSYGNSFGAIQEGVTSWRKGECGNTSGAIIYATCEAFNFERFGGNTNTPDGNCSCSNQSGGSLDCSNLISVNCNQSYNGTTSGTPRNNSSYNCFPNGNFRGGERVLEYIKENSGRVKFTLSNFGSRDLDLFLFDGNCSSTNCIRSSTNQPSFNEEITTNFLSAGTYYLVIDSEFSNSEGSFTLTINDDNCPSCDLPFNVVTECSRGSDGIAYVDFNSGGAAVGLALTYSYQWSNGQTGGEINNLAPGNYSVTLTDNNTGCSGSKVFTVDACCNVSFDIVTSSSCQNASTGIAYVDFNSGGAVTVLASGYSYQWSNGQTSGEISNLSSGTYRVTVTENSTGCSASKSGVVSPLSPPSMVISQTPATCGSNNGTITINQTGSNSRNFDILLDGNFYTNSSLPYTISNLASRNYSLRITDENGCKAEVSTMVVASGSNLTANAGNNKSITCNKSSITLNGTSNQSVSYQWQASNGGNIVSGANTASPVVNSPGTYTLTVRDSDGCDATDNVVINDGRTTPSASAGPEQTITCDRRNVTLGSQAISGLSYIWEGASINNSNQNQSNPIVDQTGTYRVTVTDDNSGCTNIGEVIISGSTTPPVAAASADSHILNCDVTQVILQAQDADPSARYEWFREDGSSYSTTQSVITTTPDTYTLVVTNTTNGCTETSEITIQEDKATPSVSTDGPKTLTCDNPTATLMGIVDGQAEEVYWLTPNGTKIVASSITADQIGTHTFHAINTTSGCQANTSVIVTGETAIPIADTGPSQTLNCNISKVTLGASPVANHTYQWSGPNGFTSDRAQPSAEGVGEYFLTVTNTNSGCSADNMVTITRDTITPNIAPIASTNTLTCSNTVVELNAQNSSEGNFSYGWLRSDGSTAGNLQKITANQADTYSLTVTNTDNGCSANSSITIAEDKAVPMIDAGTDIKITCDNPTATLNGNVAGADEIYWTNGLGEQIAEMTQTSIGTKGTYTLNAINTSNGCSATDQVIVSGDADIPTANAGPDQAITCATTLITIGSSIDPSLNYSWGSSNGFSSNQPTPSSVDQAGIYVLMVTNPTNNCTISDTVIIENRTQLPEIKLNGSLSICGNNPTIIDVELNNSETAEWQRDTGGTFNIYGREGTVEIDRIGTYKVIISNTETGCISEEEFIVEANPDTPIADAGQEKELDCRYPNIILDASLSSNGSNITYEWDGPGITTSNRNTQNPSINIPGFYQLVVTNTSSGCSATASVNIEESLDAPIVEAGRNQFIGCQINAVQLDGSQSSNDANLVYRWEGVGINDFNRNEINPRVTQAGIYTLIIENTINGCINSDRVEVISYAEDLSFNPSIIQSDCTINNGAITLNLEGGVPPFDIKWDNGRTAFAIDNVGAGTYQVSVEDAAGCIQQSSFTVENRGAPEVDLSQHDAAYCQGDVVRLDAGGSGGTQFNWSTGETTTSIQAETSDTYKVTVTNNAGCEGIAQVEIVFLNELELGYELSSDNPICLGDSLGILIQDFGTLDNEGNPMLLKQFTAVPTISKVLTESISNQCTEKSIDIPIEVYEQLVMPILDTFITKGGDLNLNISNATNFNWESSDAILSCNNCAEINISTQDSAYVNYKIIDNNSCPIEGTFLVNVIEDITDIFPHINAISPNGDGSNDQLYFPRLENYSNNKLTIFNRWGDVIYEKVGYQSDEDRWTGMFKGELLPAGVYYYVLAVNDTSTNIKSAITLIRENQ